MNEKQTQCDRRRIEQCLGDLLSEQERSDFESHLESCPDCRRELESSAADIGDWQAARDFLSSSSNVLESSQQWQPQSLSLAGEPAESQRGTSDLELAQIDDVLAVLGPTDDPRML